MQKKIIALAVAAALTAPALAFADVTVTGQINMSIDVKNNGASPSASANQLNDNQSRLVFKGSEDLGSGMSAIFQLDNRFVADTGAAIGNLFSGNTYLGVQSADFGTLKAGNMDTPFKSSTRNLDLFFDVAGDNRTGLGGLLGGGHDARLNNSLIYTSPSMSGFSVAVGTVFGAEAPVANSTKGSLYSLAGMYSMNGIYASLAYDTAKAGSVGTGDLAAGSGKLFGTTAAVNDEAKSLRLGVGYTMDQITASFVFEQPKYTTGGVQSKNTNYNLEGKFAVSSTDAVRAGYTKHGATDVGGVKATDSANQFAIGYSHDMSKATSVYATYVKTSADGALPDPSTLSFGLKHAF